MYRYYINCNNWNPTHDQWIYATRCITKNELERIDKFVFQRDAKFAIAGQLLTRYLLAQALECKSSEFNIQRTERGRPFIVSTRKFDFNYSHHNQLVCIAGTFDGDIGCDTMEYQTNTKQRQTIEETTDLLRGEFTQNEKDFILKKSKDENIRFAHFNRIWCLKESYVKWLGHGISHPLASLDFHINTDEFDKNNPEQILSNTILDLKDEKPNDELRFDEQIIYLSDNEQQIIALCLSKTNKCQPFIELNIDEILKGCTSLDENQQGDEKSWENFQKKKLK